MSIESKSCPECNGSGRVLNHMYDSGTVARNQSAGMGMIRCPRCNGSGKVQGYVSDNATGSSADASFHGALTSTSTFIGMLLGALVGWTFYESAIKTVAGAAIGGFLGGLLMQFRVGRYALMVVYIAFAALIGYSIFSAITETGA